MNRPDLPTRAAVRRELIAVAAEFIDQIDGGDECRGRDSTNSMLADLLLRAADELALA